MLNLFLINKHILQCLLFIKTILLTLIFNLIFIFVILMINYIDLMINPYYFVLSIYFCQYIYVCFFVIRVSLNLHHFNPNIYNLFKSFQKLY